MARIGGPEQQKSKVIGGLRKAQLVTTFGTGAIVDMPDYSVVMGSTDYWHSASEQNPKIHEPSLERHLGMRYFLQPQATESQNGFPMDDIPAFRFPYMHFCPKCNRLMSFNSFGGDEGLRCMNPECGKPGLVPSRFIASCINGHLEDFPYQWWVHRGNPGSCSEADRYDKLSIHFETTSGGLGSVIILCSACGATRSMEGSMGIDALAGYACKGKRPWIGMKKESWDSEPCSASMVALQRGASNVYFPITASAITIPPWSSELQIELQNKTDMVDLCVSTFSNNTEALKTALSKMFSELLRRHMYKVEDILDAIRNNEGSSDSTEFTTQQLFEQEYMALSQGTFNEPRFKTIKAEVPQFLGSFFADIVLVSRLREVLALKGFRRIYPEIPQNDDRRTRGYNGSDYVSLSKNPKDWLPAMEMFGEGIFIKLNEERLAAWEDKNSARYGMMANRLTGKHIGHDNFSRRYVLLHTLSHLIIRQLVVECGYSSSSLKERLYSTFENSPRSMEGILIYTSSTDSDGSLGGLVRQGNAINFENIIRSMLQEASWCSSDPLCIDSKSQGLDSLNYAACHACTLLPETSCEAWNCLLDRVSIIGTSEDRSIGYFGSVFAE
jgi:hypothetical protein